MKTKLNSAKFDLDATYEDLLSNMSDKTESYFFSGNKIS
jgi:hypothetical protein